MRTMGKLLAIAIVCSVGAFAQHGGGRPSGAGGGPPMGMPGGAPSSPGGSGSMGHAPGTGHDMGAPNTHGGNMGKMSPDQALAKNSHLSSNLEKILPNGMTAQQACSGFRNLGQCVAAAHVANNLNIPFADLKAKMASGDSLGKAIQALKPDANAKAEAKKGQKQADDDLKESGS